MTAKEIYNQTSKPYHREAEIEKLKKENHNLLECLIGVKSFLMRATTIRGWYTIKDLIEQQGAEIENTITKAKEVIK